MTVFLNVLQTTMVSIVPSKCARGYAPDIDGLKVSSKRALGDAPTGDGVKVLSKCVL